jgi:hypothetical protein
MSSNQPRFRAPIGYWCLLGVALMGCSRGPLARKPVPVYVDAAALARLHPQWPDVMEFDRQIAALAAFAPRAVPPVGIATVSAQTPTQAVMAVDLEALRRRIATTLDAVRDRERRTLEARLVRARRRERAAGVSAERAALEDEAEKRFQAVLDARGAEMANLAVQISALTALERDYTARGAKWADLAKQIDQQRQDQAKQLEDARTRRTAEVNGVFDWLTSQLAAKESAEAATAEEWKVQHMRELDALDASIEKQKDLLLSALEGVSAPVPLPAAGAPPPPLELAPHAPPLPSPHLGQRIAVLRARRAALASFVLQNTRAIVKSAAGQADPVEAPVFVRTSRPLPDRTADFRSAVRDAPTVLDTSS